MDKDNALIAGFTLPILGLVRLLIEKGVLTRDEVDARLQEIEVSQQNAAGITDAELDPFLFALRHLRTGLLQARHGSFSDDDLRKVVTGKRPL